jgi:hypothetical protein
MALVITGDDLVTPILQPGWTVIADGFGLNTSTSVFKGDTTTDIDAFLVKGSDHPDEAYAYLKLDKWRISWDALDICTITVDYVGIDPVFNEGLITNANTSGANGLTTSPITSHPNFFVNVEAFGASAIAGEPDYTQEAIGPLVDIKNAADYITNIIDGKPVVITKQQSFIGLHGSCFESENGGRFIGFVDPEFPMIYGKTSYLATTTTYSGVVYMTESESVLAILGYLNHATSTTAWGAFDLLPDWAIVGTVEGVGHVNLLSQVNVEEFGALYKISYEIRYASVGWWEKVYINDAAPEEGGGG